MRLSSSAFADHGTIPAKYTCEGPDLSPPLVWTDVPSGAKSLVLIVEDPDAPDPAAPKRIWCHWILYGLPPEDGALEEAVTRAKLPHGTLEGLNDSDEPGWSGPCPPIGRHRYFFRLYALDKVLPDLDLPRRKAMLDAMEGHVLAVAEWMGTRLKHE